MDGANACAFYRNQKRDSDKLYYRKQNRLPIVGWTAQMLAPFIGIKKRDSDKLYYNTGNFYLSIDLWGKVGGPGYCSLGTSEQ